MLTLNLPAREYYDYATERFVDIEEREVVFNHSLYAIAKWESRFCKPFLEQRELTNEEAKYYFQCMANKPISSGDLTNRVIRALNDYVIKNVSATTFREDPNAPKQKKQIMTSEVMYGFMVVGQIPFECEHWHISRLQNLIRVVNDLQTPDDKKKKMTVNDTVRQNADLNAQRRAAMNSKG